MNYKPGIRKFKFQISYFLFTVLLFILFSCSPKVSHSVLSFFFDGVPDNNKISAQKQPALNVIQDTTKQNQKLKIKNQKFFHPPYAENKCDVCHDKESMGKVLEPLPGLCYKCHDDFEAKYPIKHGPVAGGFCTACHSPHFTENAKLLLRKGQQLCLYCHSSTDLLKNPAHKDIGETNCIECHNPHGGKEKYFLN